LEKLICSPLEFLFAPHISSHLENISRLLFTSLYFFSHHIIVLEKFLNFSKLKFEEDDNGNLILKKIANDLIAI